MSTQTKHGTALITGASSGIGAVYADRLAHRGYDLILAGRDSGRLERLAGDLHKATGRKTEIMTADLSSRSDLETLEQRLRNDAGIDLFVNNAGLGAVAPLVESDVDQLEAMIQVNVVAFTRLAAAAASAFAKRGSGTIVNIGSAVALGPEMLNGAYNGTKAYVLNFTQSMQNELAGKGVQIQAVLPGAIGTEFWARSGLPVANLPKEMVMSVQTLVDAALAGLDQGELVTIPSLPDLETWTTFVAARKALRSGLSRAESAPRYRKSEVNARATA
jgi:short-subunit dehydrogenase